MRHVPTPFLSPFQNVVTAAVREEALQHDEELQRDMAATGQAVPPISVNKLRKEWLDKPGASSCCLHPQALAGTLPWRSFVLGRTCAATAFVLSSVYSPACSPAHFT